MFDSITANCAAKTKGRMPEAQFMQALSDPSLSCTVVGYLVPWNDNSSTTLSLVMCYSDFLCMFVTAAKECMCPCENTVLGEYSEHLLKHLSGCSASSLAHL